MDLEKPMPAKQAADVGVGAVAVPVLTTSLGNNLLDLSGELQYFTTALIMLQGHFDRDPVAMFQEYRGGDPSPFAIDQYQPLFQGLGVSWLPPGELVHWDHRLYAIPHGRWEECREFICHITITDARRRQYTEIVWQDIPVVDPGTLQDEPFREALPFIPVTVFCVSTNKFLAYISEADRPPLTRPYPAVRVADPRVVARGEAAFNPEKT